MLLDHHFLVEWGGSTTEFFYASGLTLWRNIVQTRIGSNPSDNAMIESGESHFNNIVLRRFVQAGKSELYQWYMEQAAGPSPRDIQIKILNRKHEPVMVWRLFNCLPARLSYSDLSADTADPVVEEIELAVEQAVVDFE